MVLVDLIGQLGNQMFQYAFATGVAKKKGTLFILNPTGSIEISKFFKLDPFSRFLLSRWGHRYLHLFLSKLKNYTSVTQDGWDSSDSILIKNKIHYIGFFQSDAYFSDCLNTIKKRFQIKRQYISIFEKKYADMFKSNKVIVIHIRRGDYANFGSDELGGIGLVLPMSYYDNCLNGIDDIGQYKVIFISDDIDYVKEYYKDRRGFLFESNEAIVDFQLLLNADIAIIANSSFAWWAAYLNIKKEKKIYAPKYWLGFKVKKEYPVDILPQEFIQVEVY